MEQKCENLRHYDGAMINDISSQLSREVHISHFVDKTRARIEARLPVPAGSGYPQLRAQTRASLDPRDAALPECSARDMHIPGSSFRVWLSRARCNVWLRAALDVTLSFVLLNEIPRGGKKTIGDVSRGQGRIVLSHKKPHLLTEPWRTAP